MAENKTKKTGASVTDFVKSIEKPDELTTSEILRLDAWLTHIVTIQQKYVAMYNAGLHADPTETFLADAEYWLDGRFARAWFELNKDWLGVNTPMRSEFEYLEELKSRL